MITNNNIENQLINDNKMIKELNTKMFNTNNQLGNNLLLSKSMHKLIYKQPIRIICYGDSWTYGVFSDGSGKSYPTILKELLIKNYRYADVDVINKGVGGWRAIDGLLHIDEQVISLNPNVVFIMFGINDCRGLNGEIISLENYKIHMSNMIQKLIYNNIEVCIVGSGAIADKTNNCNYKLLSYVNAAKELAIQYNCAFINLTECMYSLFFKGVYSLSDIIGSDNVHPKSYNQIANIIFEQGLVNTKNVLEINSDCEVPLVNSAYIDTDFSIISKDDIVGDFYIIKKNGSTGSFLSCPFIVTQPNTDLILRGIKNINSGLLDIYDNGVKVKTINFFSKELDCIFDTEETVIKNLSLGSHFIEIKSSNISDGLSADSSRTAIFISSIKFKSSTSIESYDFEMFSKVIDAGVKYKTTNGVGNKLIPNTNVELIKGTTLVVDTKIKFSNKTAFTWLGNSSRIPTPNSKIKSINNGLGLVFESNSLKLRIFGDKNEVLPIGPGDEWSGSLNLNEPHIVRIEQTSNGNIKILIDGVLTISCTVNVAWSGSFGFYSFDSSPSEMMIYYLNYCHITNI